MYKLPIPAKKALMKLGGDIKDARLRRRIPARLLAERAGISMRTLGNIEKGLETVAFGNYASVIFSLGMINRIEDLLDANHDKVGRMLEEENLPKRIKLPKK